jgi:hypothetical protein
MRRKEALMGGVETRYKYLAVKCVRKRLLGRLGVDRRIILKCI